MKCPKCGFTSFDYLEECNKCGNDLTMVRGQLGVISVGPDDRAAVGPSGPAVAEEAPVDVGFGTLETPGADFLSDVEETDRAFEQSFEDLVEPTTLDTPLPEAAPAATTGEMGGGGNGGDMGGGDIGDDIGGDIGGGIDDILDEKPEADADVEPDEEFLDLDFGNIFDDDQK